jgi:hypothetical protein
MRKIWANRPESPRQASQALIHDLSVVWIRLHRGGDDAFALLTLRGDGTTHQGSPEWLSRRRRAHL